MLHGVAPLLVLLSSLAAPAPADPGATPEQAALLKQVATDVERIRGLKFRRPVPMRVVGDAETRKHALQRLDDLQAREALEAEIEAYRALGLLPRQGDVLETVLGALEEQVGGFYDPRRETFFLLDDMPQGLAPALIAHELTHAIEDQTYDLDARLRGAKHDEDLGFALSAVHEGSATLVMTLYAAEAIRAGRMRGDDLQAFARTEAGRGDRLAALPPVLYRQLIGTYVLGAQFLMRGNPVGAEFPVSDVRRAFRDGPRSSEQILHPDLYWERRDDPRPVELGEAGARLGEAWSRAAHGTLGELVLAVLTGAPTPGDFTTAWGIGASGWTNTAAAGWGGDRWELWRRGKDRAVLVGTVWDSEEDARQFEAALGTGPTFAFERRKRAVAIVAGIPAESAAPVLDAVLAAASRRRG
jgi:hypothetical protein